MSHPFINPNTYNGVKTRPQTQVTPKAQRRTFTAKYKLRILEEADAVYRTRADWRTATSGRTVFIEPDDVASATRKRADWGLVTEEERAEAGSRCRSGARSTNGFANKINACKNGLRRPN